MKNLLILALCAGFLLCGCRKEEFYYPAKAMPVQSTPKGIYRVWSGYDLSKAPNLLPKDVLLQEGQQVFWYEIFQLRQDGTWEDCHYGDTPQTYQFRNGKYFLYRGFPAVRTLKHEEILASADTLRPWTVELLRQHAFQNYNTVIGLKDTISTTKLLYRPATNDLYVGRLFFSPAETPAILPGGTTIKPRRFRLRDPFVDYLQGTVSVLTDYKNHDVDFLVAK